MAENSLFRDLQSGGRRKVTKEGRISLSLGDMKRPRYRLTERVSTCYKPPDDARRCTGAPVSEWLKTAPCIQVAGDWAGLRLWRMSEWLSGLILHSMSSWLKTGLCNWVKAVVYV